MSIATLPQGTHTLTLIGQQDPSAEDLRILHDGYLTDLMQAIKARTVPARHVFRKSLGLPPIERQTVAVDNQFEPLNSFDVIVPKGYNHATFLGTFGKEHRQEFCRYHDAITDRNFSKATRPSSSLAGSSW